MLKNASLLAIVAVDTAENEPTMMSPSVQIQSTTTQYLSSPIFALAYYKPDFN